MDAANYRHAYLIIAHNNFAQLQTLISLLDDERNDIYLHIDKKATTFTPDMVHTNHSCLFLTDRLSVSWGGESLIQCELLLLRAALPAFRRKMPPEAGTQGSRAGTHGTMLEGLNSQTSSLFLKIFEIRKKTLAKGRQIF